MAGFQLKSTHGGIGASTLGFCLARSLDAELLMGRAGDVQPLIAAGLSDNDWPKELWLAGKPALEIRAEALFPMLPASNGIRLAAGAVPPTDLLSLVQYWAEHKFVVSEIGFESADLILVAPNSLQGYSRITELLAPPPAAIFLQKTSSNLSRAGWRELLGNVPIFEFTFQKRVFQSLDAGIGISDRSSMYQASQEFRRWLKFSEASSD
jgi:hypothetical protein